MSNPLGMLESGNKKSAKNSKNGHQRQQQELSEKSRKRRRQNLSLNIKKLQSEMEHLSEFSLVTPKRKPKNKRSFKESLLNATNSKNLKVN